MDTTHGQNRAIRARPDAPPLPFGRAAEPAPGAMAFRYIVATDRQTPESRAAEWARWVSSATAVPRPPKPHRDPPTR